MYLYEFNSKFCNIAEISLISEIVYFLNIFSVLYRDKKVLRGKVYSGLKAIFENNLTKAERNLAKATEANDEAGIAKHKRAVNEFTLVVDNWAKLVALTDDQIKRIDGSQPLTLRARCVAAESRTPLPAWYGRQGHRRPG